MRAFQVNFERGFALHYPDALGSDKGVVFVFHKLTGRNTWTLYLDTDGDVPLLDVTPPPELHVPTGAVGRAWHGHGLQAELGFALEQDPEPFDGHLKHVERQGWVVQSQFQMMLCCLENDGIPGQWAWIGECGDCPFCSLEGGCPMHLSCMTSTGLNLTE